MKSIVASAIALPFAAIHLVLPAQAATLGCGGAERARFEAVCANARLNNQITAIERRFAQLLAASDPLTALLLRRDQSWFSDIVGAEGSGPLPPGSETDENFQRMENAMQQRRAAVEKIKPGGQPTPEGEWLSALGNVTVAKSGDGFDLTLRIRQVYGDINGAQVCALTATLKPDTNGWYAGKGTAMGTVAEPGDPDPAAGSEAGIVRMRMQGNTLRVVTASEAGAVFCNSVDLVTGTFFPASGTPSKNDAALAARTVKPSFDCAGAANTDEEEICADPDLARADADIAALYRAALARLDARAAGHLRADQRAWVEANAVAFDSRLMEASDKRNYDVHHTSGARAELALRQRERAFMLANLEPGRKTLEGLWVAHNAMLSFRATAGAPAGTVSAKGGKVEIGDYKASCEFDADGRFENGAFRTKDEFPQLARDGVTLTLNAGDPDNRDDFFDKNGKVKIEQPGYCRRMHSPKARLFPIKADAGIEKRFDRLR